MESIDRGAERYEVFKTAEIKSQDFPVSFSSVLGLLLKFYNYTK